MQFTWELRYLAWRVSQSQNMHKPNHHQFSNQIFFINNCSFWVLWTVTLVFTLSMTKIKKTCVMGYSFKNHHQTFHDRCLEKIGHLQKKSDHWCTQKSPENMSLAPTCFCPQEEIWQVPRAVCCSGVGNNSIQCTQCKLWVSKRCSDITKPLVAEPNYVCHWCNSKDRPINDRIVTEVDACCGGSFLLTRWHAVLWWGMWLCLLPDVVWPGSCLS